VKLVIAQESYYSDHTRYADVADSLRVRIEGGGRLFILYADERHWAGCGGDAKHRTDLRHGGGVSHAGQLARGSAGV